MCSRFSIAVNSMDLRHFFEDYDGYDSKVPEEYEKRYNFAPGQNGLVYHDDKLDYIKWGFEVSWSKFPLINARSENIESNKVFGKVLDNKCLVPADGFLEWKKVGSDKIPYRFTIGEMFVFPGLLNKYKDRFAIITTNANETVSKVHDRMPVVLSKEEGKLWLDGDLSVLKPYRFEMQSKILSKKINNPRNEGEDLIKEDTQRTLV